MRNRIEVMTKFAARALIERMDGQSVQTALDRFETLELGINSNLLSHPAHIQPLIDILAELSIGSKFEAIRQAREVILDMTPVSTRTEATSMLFALWDKEAALAGASMVA